MLRPPRAPLAVPRCPHRPHGGRLSQPEALQQGSNGAEERRRGRVSPPARGGRVEGAGCWELCDRELLSEGGRVCVCVCVCVSVGARARVAGDPRGPRPREARVGKGSSLWALRCWASSALGVRLPTSQRESGERLDTLVHSTGKAGFPGRVSAAVASEEEEKEGGSRQTPQFLGGDAERGHPFRERTAANKARIGGWLATGAPAAARAAVRGVGTTLSARSRASGAAEESIIQISATASSSPSASRWVQLSPSTHRRADTHTHTHTHTHTRTESAPMLLPVLRHPRTGTHSSDLREPES
ncbi:uncharacterized protein LOC115831169 [Nomascus leucogenys]|uniref:uncharacterized protein LOC115831169 n=1 Tax=Nomascus leucogenys TaxID=61853 RepID=UPI00122D7924|nr:uncharacterized protein LOC115831169 [Nomascus leucogenys]